MLKELGMTYDPNIKTYRGSDGTPVRKNTVEAAPRVDDLFANSPANSIPATISLEKPCCLNTTRPCQHWVWDVNTGEGYVNSLSGRTLEVE